MRVNNLSDISTTGTIFIFVNPLLLISAHFFTLHSTEPCEPVIFKSHAQTLLLCFSFSWALNLLFVCFLFTWEDLPEEDAVMGGGTVGESCHVSVEEFEGHCSSSTRLLLWLHIVSCVCCTFTAETCFSSLCENTEKMESVLSFCAI